MAEPDKDDDYEVGYGKPPRHGRFQKGQSGNPKGRPPRSRNISTILQETLFRPVQIKEGGRSRKVSQLEAFMMLVTKTALSGDGAAANRMIRLLPLLIQAVEAEAMRAQADDDTRSADQVTSTDTDVLQHFADMLRAGDFELDGEADQ